MNHQKGDESSILDLRSYVARANFDIKKIHRRIKILMPDSMLNLAIRFDIEKPQNEKTSSKHVRALEEQILQTLN